MSRDGATVFVGGSESDSSHDGKLYAVDASTGIQKWSFATGGSVFSSGESRQCDRVRGLG